MSATRPPRNIDRWVAGRKHEFGQVIGNRLITADVGEGAIFNFGNAFQFNIYSLDGTGSPEQPQLLAFNAPNYLFAQDLVIGAGRAFVPHFYFRVNDSIGDYIFQSGGLLAFDLNDITGNQVAPPFAFPNDNGNYSEPPVGFNNGFYINGQAAFGDANTLYTAGSTGFADNTPGAGESVNTDIDGNPSVGRINLYDISDPESVSFVGDPNAAATGLLIPGTSIHERHRCRWQPGVRSRSRRRMVRTLRFPRRPEPDRRHRHGHAGHHRPA